MPRRPPLTACPCCKTKLDEPIDVEVIAWHTLLTEDEETALFVLIDARGRPVTGEKIGDTIYSDDPNGGPSLNIEHDHLKQVMHGLMRKLQGTQLGIERLGIRGWVIRVAPTGFSGWSGA